jgi:hypothetical protein
VTSEKGRGPRPLSWSLRRIASEVSRVDLVGFAAVEGVWPGIESARASRARPQRLAGLELVVAVPSGMHAARAKLDAAAILDELGAALGCGTASAPTSLRVVVGSAESGRVG